MHVIRAEEEMRDSQPTLSAARDDDFPIPEDML
jgi:hypothetical protein